MYPAPAIPSAQLSCCTARCSRSASLERLSGSALDANVANPLMVRRL